MRTRWIAWLSVTLVVLGALAVPAAEPLVELRARYSSVAAKARPMLVLEFYTMKRDKRKLTAGILDWKRGAPYDPASYRLETAGGQRIDATPVAEQLGDELGDSVAFVLKGKLAPGTSHKLTVSEGKLFFQLPAGEVVSNSLETLVIPAEAVDQINESMDEDKAGASENSIQLAGGTSGGVGIIRYTYRRYEFLNSRWLNLELNANADFTLINRERQDYFNSLSGELNFFRVFTAEKWPFEIGAHGRTESDQAFDVTDGLLGAQVATRLQDPVTRLIGGLLQPNHHAPPLVILGYDYAQNLGGNESGIATSTGVDTGRADHRLTGLLRWRIPLATAYEFTLVPGLSGKYDLDLDLEAKGIYDVNAEKFLDRSSVSLVFRRTADNKFRPALSFTWARGKEGPTFEQVNALLAGLKLEF